MVQFFLRLWYMIFPPTFDGFKSAELTVTNKPARLRLYIPTGNPSGNSRQRRAARRAEARSLWSK